MASQVDINGVQIRAKRQRVESVKETSLPESSIAEGAKTGDPKGVKVNSTCAKLPELEQMTKVYKKENSVIANIEGIEVAADEIIESIGELCGHETVMGCVPCGRNAFEITMTDKNYSDVLIPSLKVGNKNISVSSVSDKSVFVSILHLPTYVTDDEILEKMKSYKIQIVSPIYRKIRKTNTGRNIADGTRYFRVKFPEDIRSLPWSLSFEINGVNKYFKTIHDNQDKVCFKCCSADHISRECPLNECYFCAEIGHIAKDCKNKWCENCRKKTKNCDCDETEDGNDSEESESKEGESDESETETDEGGEDDDDDYENDEMEIIVAKKNIKPGIVNRQENRESNVKLLQEENEKRKQKSDIDQKNIKFCDEQTENTVRGLEHEKQKYLEQKAVRNMQTDEKKQQRKELEKQETDNRKHKQSEQHEKEKKQQDAHSQHSRNTDKHTKTILCSKDRKLEQCHQEQGNGENVPIKNDVQMQRRKKMVFTPNLNVERPFKPQRDDMKDSEKRKTYQNLNESIIFKVNY